MEFNPLYGKNADGTLKLWTVATEGNKITVRHGKLGGKMQSKETFCTGKNVGRANETSDEEQAVIEAKAKHVKQMKSGYFESQEEAFNFVEFTPMKCQDYKKFAHKIVYPCFIQPKLNGLRCMIDKNGDAWSKSGEVYKMPDHIQAELDQLAFLNLIPDGLDGEVYAGLEHQGGLSLQKIVSAFRKPNLDTPKLKFYVYDIPASNLTQEQRINNLEVLKSQISDICKNITVVFTEEIWNELDGDEAYNTHVSVKYEGSIYRNFKGEYDFGGRSYDVIKRKPRPDAEAQVVSVEKDKNGQGVLTCALESGVRFKCLMVKNSDESINYRVYDNALTLINKFITFQYEEFSDDGVPTKPTGHAIRSVDPNTWKVLE